MYLINASLTEYIYLKKIDTAEKLLKETKLIDKAKVIAHGKQGSYSTAEKGLVKDPAGSI
jgi:hypothetical protein